MTRSPSLPWIFAAWCVDDDMETFLAIVDSMHASDSVRDKMSHCLPCKLSGRLREKKLFVGKFRLRCDNDSSIMVVAEKVKAKMHDTVVAKRTPRHSSASNSDNWRTTGEQLANNWRTTGEQLGSLRCDTQNRYKTRITPSSAIWPWMV